MMRTRRSPRNQARLWRALGAVATAPPRQAAPMTDAEIDALPISRPAKAAERRAAQAARMRLARRRASD